MMYSTLKLDSNWDLTVDALGNIASDDTSYAVAQDVASAVRTVRGELFYDVQQGVPYFASVLGQNFSPQLFQAYVEQAALSVPGVTQAQASLEPVTALRALAGRVRIIDELGESLNATF